MFGSGGQGSQQQGGFGSVQGRGFGQSGFGSAGPVKWGGGGKVHVMCTSRAALSNMQHSKAQTDVALMHCRQLLLKANHLVSVMHPCPAASAEEVASRGIVCLPRAVEAQNPSLPFRNKLALVLFLQALQAVPCLGSQSSAPHQHLMLVVVGER